METKTLSVKVEAGEILSAGKVVGTYKLNDKARVDELTLDGDVLLSIIDSEAFDGFMLFAAQEWIRYKANNNPKEGAEVKLKDVLATLGGYWKAPSAETVRKRGDEIIAAIKAAKAAGDAGEVARLKAELFALHDLGDI